MKTANHTALATGFLPVMEQFYTIQGEGYHQGKAAYFIRLGGCDVGCVWCDVKESWDAAAHPHIQIEDIVKVAQATPARLAVITGGEPTLYDLNELTTQLKAAGFQTNIETSGAHELTGHFDWVCLSPKKFKPPVERVLKQADELKIIVFNKSDFKWAESFAAKVRKDCMLFLQPEWSKAEKMTPLIVDYIKANPQWQLSLQIHKYIHVP
ncbi:MAG TPA: 7-carboxy-7-deazaguanine synthase QueE [Ginsengibacter sp.]|nr:7-carboxy-7-deazaguanine synthase QueE [Ginsengibacter sp.]HRP44598.1 7-carboxy-7-deazaguanine synthase QueE [Ginsengibacter sp.]